MKNVVLIGANSFIGKAIRKITSGVNLTSIGRKECDLLDPFAVKKLGKYLTDESTVVFLAGIPRRKVLSAHDCKQNIAMVCTLADAIQKYRPKHFIYASSIDVYGIGCEKKIISEQSPLSPTDLYGISKVTNENILTFVCNDVGTELLLVRISGVYGNNEPHGNPVSIFAQSCKNGDLIKVTDNGMDVRSYIFVDDAAAVLLKCGKDKLTGIVNLVGPSSMTVMEYAEKVQSFYNKTDSLTAFPGSRPNTFHYFDRNRLFSIMDQSEFTTIDEALATFVHD